MNEPLSSAIPQLHEKLASMERRICSRPPIMTGVRGVRIMRLVALMSGNAFRYAMVTTKRKGRWC